MENEKTSNQIVVTWDEVLSALPTMKDSKTLRQIKQHVMMLHNAEGLFATNEDDIGSMVEALIKKDKLKGDESDLRYKDKKYTKRRGETPPKPVGQTINSTYFGIAGEYAVMSELLFNGYNVNRMTIDDGIDIIATKDNHYFYIQVKSTNLSDTRNLNWQIPLQQFLNFAKPEVRYILVARYMENGAVHNMYFILSHTDIERSIFNGSIKKTDASVSIKIKFNEKTRKPEFYDTKVESAEYFLNNFKL